MNVKPGYFRNYLLPKSLAEPATASVMKVVEQRKGKIVLQKQQLLDNAKEVIEKLKGLKVIIQAKATKKGKLYGAIVEGDVIKAIEKAVKIKLDKEFIKAKHIKEAGEHTIKIDLGEGFVQDITLVVEPE